MWGRWVLICQILDAGALSGHNWSGIRKKTQMLKMFIPNTNQKVRQWVHRWKFVRSVRPTDVFLVTYPKSGTMWVGFLLANILHGRQSPSLNLRTYLKYIPDINQLYYGNGDLSEYSNNPNPRFFSTHAPYDPAFSRVIYVMRDPRDVMVSYWYHTKLMKPSFDLSLEDFIVSDDQWPNLWHEHVKGWVLEKHERVFVMKYEDLMANTFSATKKMLDFINYQFDEQIVLHAVEMSKFEKMKSLEEKYGSGRLDESLKGFVRKGKSGSWRDEINPDILAILEKKFGSVMKAVGYETASN